MESFDKKDSVRIIAAGLVQGVGYRWHILEATRSMDLTGTVRNLRDGTVEIRAEGEQAALAALVAVAFRGPALARVSSLHIDWGEAVGRWADFQVVT